MSMILELHAVPDDAARFLLENPQWILRVLCGEDWVDVPPPQPGLLARLFGAKPVDTKPEPVPPIIHSLKTEQAYLDKAWHGIHYLFTGEAWDGEPEEMEERVESWLLLGGHQVGADDNDVGYGPARILLPPEVARWAEFLAQWDEDKLRERFDPADMMKKDIYPAIWDRDPEEDDTLGYLLEYFGTLRDFVTKQARAKKAVIIALT